MTSIIRMLKILFFIFCPPIIVSIVLLKRENQTKSLLLSFLRIKQGSDLLTLMERNTMEPPPMVFLFYYYSQWIEIEIGIGVFSQIIQIRYRIVGQQSRKSFQYIIYIKISVHLNDSWCNLRPHPVGMPCAGNSISAVLQHMRTQHCTGTCLQAQFMEIICILRIDSLRAFC